MHKLHVHQMRYTCIYVAFDKITSPPFSLSLSLSVCLSNVVSENGDTFVPQRNPKNTIELVATQFSEDPPKKTLYKKGHSGLDPNVKDLLRPLGSFSFIKIKSEGPGVISEWEDGYRLWLPCKVLAHSEAKPGKSGSPWSLMAVSQNDLITLFFSRFFKNLNEKSVGVGFTVLRSILRQARCTSCIDSKCHSKLHPENGENTVDNGLARTPSSRGVLPSKQSPFQNFTAMLCHSLPTLLWQPSLLRVFHTRVGDNTDDGYHIGSLPLPEHPQG